MPYSADCWRPKTCRDGLLCPACEDRKAEITYRRIQTSLVTAMVILAIVAALL